MVALIYEDSLISAGTRQHKLIATVQMFILGTFYSVSGRVGGVSCHSHPSVRCIQTGCCTDVYDLVHVVGALGASTVRCV